MKSPKPRFRIENSPSKKGRIVTARQPLEIRGWFATADGQAADQVELHIGKRRITMRKEARKDISKHYHFPHSERQSLGFIASFSVGPGLKRLIIIAKFGTSRRRIYQELIYSLDQKAARLKSQSNKKRKHPKTETSFSKWLLKREYLDLQQVNTWQLRDATLRTHLSRACKEADDIAALLDSNDEHPPLELSPITEKARALSELLNRAISNPQEQNISLRELGTEKGHQVIEGRLESITIEGARGWIKFRSVDPGEDYPIQVYIENTYLGDTLLGETRQDVDSDPNVYTRSFDLPIPRSLCDGKPHQLVLKDHHRPSLLFLKKNFRVSTSELSPKPAQIEDQPVIIFATHNLRSQGAQNSLFELVVGLKERGRIKPVVVSPSEGELSFAYRNAKVQLAIIPWPKRRTSSAKAWKRSLIVYANQIEKFQPIAIVANTLQSFPAALAGRITRTQTTLIVRESEPPETYFKAYPRPVREDADTVVTQSDTVVFVADATRKLWNSHDRGHFITLKNALRTERLEAPIANQTRSGVRIAFGIPENDRVILALGSVSERKGQKDLIKAIPAIIRDSTVPVSFIIVGLNHNEYSREIQSMVKGLPQEFQDRIHLVGELSGSEAVSVSDYYLCADLFCLTSRIESYPRVILEAMFFGLAIISTPCFGVLEQCIEHYNALYYPVGDEAKLTQCCLQLINDPKLLARFGANSRERFSSFPSYGQLLDSYEGRLVK